MEKRDPRHDAADAAIGPSPSLGPLGPLRAPAPPADDVARLADLHAPEPLDPLDFATAPGVGPFDLPDDTAQIVALDSEEIRRANGAAALAAPPAAVPSPIRPRVDLVPSPALSSRRPADPVRPAPFVAPPPFLSPPGGVPLLSSSTSAVPPPTLRRGPWPFVPLAPIVVLIVGLAVALGIGCVGVDHLSRASDDQAGARADLLAATVAARLARLPADRRLEATQIARRKSDAELLVVTSDARVVYDMTLGVPDRAALEQMIAAGHGVAKIRYGRARFAVRPVGDGERVVVWVAEPASAERVPRLTISLLALVTLLLGVAGAVAYAVSRDVTRDVEFVSHRVRGMAQVRTQPTGELIPARTMDEVGLLTAGFNKLVGRFGKAEKAYRQDLARASAADRERAAFLAAVSHELRSPLNAILGFADILMEEVDGPLSPAAREEVEQIRGSGAHLLALINDILEFSALESGQLKLSRGRLDLTVLANEVVREARGLIGEKQLGLRVEADGAVIARVDGRRVRQILGNLVNNAIKFTQRGEVVVRVGRENKMASLSVSDTGPGISPQERAVIFQEYKQARGERQRRRGTGLGLAIARRLVLLHAGSIQVESELGRGSTFKVLLPVGNVDAAPSVAPPPRDRHGALLAPPGKKP